MRRLIGGRETVRLAAIVDTGFDGCLCVPTRHAVKLGLELIGALDVELADGSRKSQLVFAASVRFFGETREVRLTLTDSDDALIGTAWLDQCLLSAEFPGGRIKLRARRKKGARKG